MIDVELIVAEALEWLDTPYQHQAMVKGVGVDCAMLICGVALNTGVIEKKDMKKVPAYTREWHLHNKEPLLEYIVDSFGCERVNIGGRRKGDILGFTFGRVTSHLGILIDPNYMIHARLDTGRVAINGVNGYWKRRLTAAWRFPGVEDMSYE